VDTKLTLLHGIDLRRAVIGILLAADRPLSAADIVQRMHQAGATPATAPGRRPTQVVSDVVAYQRRLGRVRRIERDRHLAVPTAMSPAMRSRSRHWRRAVAPSP